MDDVGEMEAFRANLREPDIAIMELDLERLILNRGRYESECEERERDFQQRREELLAAPKLELEKFKLMMDNLRNKHNCHFGLLSDHVTE